MFRSWTTVTLLLGKSELNPERIGRIESFTEKNRFDMIYLPAEFEEITRLSGVTVQAAALLLVAWMCYWKKFD